MLFSSFNDAFEWWLTMQSWLHGRDKMWTNELDLSRAEYRQFRLEAKTVIHAGEVEYSGTNIPISAAVNQVFKIEKEFKARELGITQQALACARPILRSHKLRPRLRGEVILPGDQEPIRIYVIADYNKLLQERRRIRRMLMEEKKS
jgi:hypothetical protein